MAIFGSGSSRNDRILRLIAFFRLSKALLLILAGFGLLKLLNPAIAAHVSDAMRSYPFVLRYHPEHVLSSPERIELVAAGAFAYAALFITEGLGLWMDKRWAEWLTAVATTSFIPFEIWELFRRVTALRIGLLMSNVAIVIYLFLRLIRQNRVTAV